MKLSALEKERIVYGENQRAEGRNEGRINERNDIARNLLLMNMSSEDISKATDLSINEIHKLNQ